MSAHKTKNDDINSKIADFMADIDEIVLGKKSNIESEQSEWQQCFDETTQAIYYWNTKTNECSWDPPPISDTQQSTSELNSKKRSQTTVESKSPKKLKSKSLIAEYTSSESENEVEEEEEDEEGNVNEIDELLEEVLEKKDEPLPSTDLYPLFEADCRAALARLSDLADRSKDILALQIQLETRLEDCLAGYLAKSYAVRKLEEALVQIDEFERIHLTTTMKPIKPSLTTSEMALLLSLPPPPPPPSPPPSSNETDPTAQSFNNKHNSDADKPSYHHHHHHSKDKKTKPAKTLPTDLIQKWTHARQELRSTIPDIDDS